ncbi:MAG TPA: alpha/beta fold hydrolase [Vicinamibacterales bacterium]|nr:alpha/beta fold hydrolase [Vicinamibacterales bacterium]
MIRGGIPGVACALLAASLHAGTGAQDRLRALPGYAQYQKISPLVAGSVRSGRLDALWSSDSRSFEYNHRGKRYRYDVASRTALELGAAPEPAMQTGARDGGRGAGSPARGRQFESAISPDGTLRAFYRDRNLWVSDVSGTRERALTTDGNARNRVKYGTASWVYGEELDQRSAMWWSPDSRKLAYYRFDETGVQDYYLQLRQTAVQSEMDVEAYPKAGSPNPIVDLFVTDLGSGRTTRVDVRDGKPFDNAVVGHYVYRVEWAPDGRELLFHRTNRRQNILELVAANPGTGATRVVLREEWPTGWVENSPPMHFLKDGRRFIWTSERSGWANLYLYDLDGRLLTPLTNHTSYEVGSLVKADEGAGLVFYTARSGDNHLKLQLHRVGIDGTGDVRLTDPAFHHTVGSCLAGSRRGGRLRGPATPASCGISPDNRYFVDVYQRHDLPPATRLVEVSGRIVDELAASDLTTFSQLGLRKAEMFTYTAADGTTTLRGLIHFPSTFDPSSRYPVLVQVYGGPGSASNTARETFVVPSALTEYGFLVVNLDSRAVPGMGKRQLDSLYLKLGQVETDDMAEGVKALASRPYVDASRVGVFGTSYGGYSAAMLILRHPDLFAAAVASSPVTAWHHYDSIYTERYMWIPQENSEGYEAGSAMVYAKNLKGRLMIYYGTADNNVHPSNALELIAALQQAGKSFDVQVGPDRGHTGINQDRMMEFFIENLIVRAPVAG